MKIIKPSATILDQIDGPEILKKIELCGRVCYKSEDKTTDDSAEKFVRMLIECGHESVLEHVSITVKFVCDRGVSHELVRHRIASYSQESTRYCNYSNDKFGREITVIEPYFFSKGTGYLTDTEYAKYTAWRSACEVSEIYYFELLKAGATPQEARSVLPNSLKTEIVMTANLREWRNVLKQRTSKGAHPQMREIMVPLLKEFQEKIPVVFDDIVPYEDKE